MKYETSAGGVIVARKNGRLQVLLIQDKTGKWTFPKGLIEKGENLSQTAIREIGEEVGIKHLKLLARLTPIKYLYKWEGKLVAKTVYYYLFRNGGTEKLAPQREEGILQVRWVPWEKVTEVVGYPKTNLVVLQEVQQKLLKLKLLVNKKP